MNVVEFGFGSTGCTLAARLLDTFATSYLTNGSAFQGYSDVWIRSPDTGAYESWFSFPVFRGTAHFPYGFEVEPDV